MKRHLLTLALAGVFGVLAISDASACCHKKKACPTPTACAVVEPCPPPPPVCEPVCAPAPKKCGLFKHNAGCGHKKMGGGLCHKKKATCAPVAYESPCGAPVYGPVSYPSGQGYASPQASGQGYPSHQASGQGY